MKYLIKIKLLTLLSGTGISTNLRGLEAFNNDLLPGFMTHCNLKVSSVASLMYELAEANSEGL